MFMDWVKEQLYNFNIIGDILIVVLTVWLSKRSTKKEIGLLIDEIQKDTGKGE